MTESMEERSRSSALSHRLHVPSPIRSMNGSLISLDAQVCRRLPNLGGDNLQYLIADSLAILSCRSPSVIDVHHGGRISTVLPGQGSWVHRCRVHGAIAMWRVLAPHPRLQGPPSTMPP